MDKKLIADSKDGDELWLRPSQLGRLVGVSAQSIRRYEAAGGLPAAIRTQGGQRRYSKQHVDALLTLQSLRRALGWNAAAHVMRAVAARDDVTALAKLDERHAAIHKRRVDTLAILDTLKALPDLPAGRRAKPVRIAEAAKRAGVTSSTLRFWEQLGLLTPARDPDNGYRLYDAAQLRRLEVICLLRRAGRTFQTIGPVLEYVDRGHVTPAIQSGERALQNVDRLSRRCAEATAALWTYLHRKAALDNEPAREGRE